MRRFLKLLACAAAITGASQAAHAQTPGTLTFNSIRLLANGKIITLQAPPGLGSNQTFLFPDMTGIVGNPTFILSNSVSGQTISGGLAINGAATFSSLTGSGLVKSDATGLLSNATIGTDFMGTTINATLTGNGTAGTPLGLNLANANTWTATQTFPTTAAQSNALVSSVNGGGTSAINVTHGGTGVGTITQNGVVFGNATSPVGATAAGTNGQVLLGATGAAPAFGTIGTGTTGSDVNFTTGANSLTLNIPDASTTARGVVTTGAQTFAGAKTFNGATTAAAGLNLSGTTSPLSLNGAAGTANQILTSAGAGATPTWTSVNNGLTLSGGNLQLGGALTGATTITTSAGNNLTVGGNGNFTAGNGSGTTNLGTGTGATNIGNATGATTITGSTNVASLNGGGIVKSAAGTGALSNASAGVDYLSTVNHNATLTGAGNTATPLGINLGNSNIWTGAQTFNAVTTAAGGLDLSGATSPLSVGGNAGTSNQLLTSAGAGNTPTWTTVNNGLTLSSGNLKLGGTLTGATEIANGGNNLAITGTGEVSIGTNAPFAGAMLDVAGDNSAPFPGQLLVTGATTPSQMLMLGYNTLADYGSIQSIYQGVSVKPLYINADGGNVGIGNLNASNLFAVGTSTTPANQFQVDGTGAIANATGITSSGAVNFSGLSTDGIVKTTGGTGTLAVAVAGTDYESPLTFGNGLTRTSNDVALGGALSAPTVISTSSGNDLSIDGGGNIAIVNSGSVSVGTQSNSTIVGNGSSPTATTTVQSSTVDINGFLQTNVGTTTFFKTAVGSPGSITEIKGNPLNINITSGTTNIGNASGATTLVGVVRVDNLSGAGSNLVMADNLGTLSNATVGVDYMGTITDVTLSGNGSSGSPLSVNLANPNTWSATQTIGNTASLDVQGDVINSTGAVIVNDDLSVAGGVTLSSITGGILTADNSGVVGVATAGTDYLATVNHDGTLTGSGNTGSALGIDLTNPNTWSGAQTFNGGATMGSTLDLNGNNITSSGTIVLNNNSQVNGNLNVSGLTNGLVNASGGTLGMATAGIDYIDAVNHDGTLTGSGNTASQLGLDLAASNTWTGNETFNGTVTVTGLNGLVTASGGVLGSAVEGADYLGANVGSGLTGNGTSGSPLDLNTGHENTWSVTQSFNNGTTAIVVDGPANINSGSSNTGTTDIGNTSSGGAVTVNSASTVSMNAVTSVSASAPRFVINNGHLQSTQTGSTSIADVPSVSNTSTLTNATDIAGKLAFTADATTPASGTQTSVTFATAYGTAPIVVITPADATTAAAINNFYVAPTTGGFTIEAVNAPSANATYNFFYHVIETQ